jgi:hypothetical protein
MMYITGVGDLLPYTPASESTCLRARMTISFWSRASLEVWEQLAVAVTVAVLFHILCFVGVCVHNQLWNLEFTVTVHI